MSFLVTTTPVDRNPTDVLHVVCTRLRANFAIVRHGVSEEIGPRRNKQTLKYLVD